MDEHVYQVLLQSGFRFVSFRPRSEKEFIEFYRKKLEKRNINDPEMLDALLSRQRELGYINDDAFAQWWVTQRTGRSPKGPRIIKQELKEKGIDPSIISASLSSLAESDISSRDLALRSIEKKRTLWSRLPVIEQKRKMFDFLTRRGFDTDVIYSVIDEVT